MGEFDQACDEAMATVAQLRALGTAKGWRQADHLARFVDHVRATIEAKRGQLVGA